jgi:hypothetical protein
MARGHLGHQVKQKLLDRVQIPRPASKDGAGRGDCPLEDKMSEKLSLILAFSQRGPCGGVAHMVEHLLCKCEVLSSNPNPTKKNKRGPCPEYLW